MSAFIPKFSIVLTTYNREQYIERAILSVIQQTESNWELLVIDDGSTDNTEKLIQPYLNINQSVYYFKQENRGEVSAKNRGISLSCGEYITFLDSDDAYKMEHLQYRSQIINQHPMVDLLYGGVEVIGDEFVPDRRNKGRRIHLSDCVIGGTFFIKREVLFELGGFRTIDIGADADLFDRIVRAKKNTLKMNSPTYIYHREYEDSITHNYFQERKH
ncbi:MAG TPA: glycosyltransferase [Chitinophagales bacterium]|nr:glycosyltransferase [Chitinophagales bacterium]HNI01466.1 glycosyltransferase [Chitinophagales bacterium]